MEIVSTTLALVVTFAGAVAGIVIWRLDRELAYLALALFFAAVFGSEASQAFGTPGVALLVVLQVLKVAGILGWLVLERRARQQRIQRRLATAPNHGRARSQ